jgi:Holliday junction resolvasome RuvABC endonuclease subunit
MKKLLTSVSDTPSGTYCGIDVASHSLALTVGEKDENGDIWLKRAGKIEMPEKDMQSKLIKINNGLETWDSIIPFDKVTIEQSIYIQNYQTSRILSYIIGFTMGKLLDMGAEVQDVPPMVWKSYIGYKRISKKEKEEKIQEVGKTEGNKWLNSERKYRVKKLIDQKVPQTSHISDLDVIDSIGIFLWTVENWGKDKNGN